MIDASTLLSAGRKLVELLTNDLRARTTAEPTLREHLRGEWEKARAARRTALAFEAWCEDPLEQAAVAWVLSAVFVRFLEDNGFLDSSEGARRLLWGSTPELQALATAHRDDYVHRHPTHSDRELFLSVFGEVGALPGARYLFDPKHNPVFSLGPSADGARELRVFWNRRGENGALLFDFTDAARDTRFLGDLYQDLSEHARKKYALLQTPRFVESFLLDRSLEPALQEFGLENVRLIDPACGSGHFLLGAFERLVSRWQTTQPGLPLPELSRRALAAVYGVDVNPFAAAIARFRLLIAAFVAARIERLEGAHDLRPNVAVGDSLLHGPMPGRKSQDSQRELKGMGAYEHLYETEDAEELKRILGQRYHVVVANPPYIIVRDGALNALYRERFQTCKGKYSLVCPFLERILDLSREPGAVGTAGYVAVIASNAFMKREFGSKLIEEWIPKWDLTHVVDTSGAYIPGHGTPTVILMFRGGWPTSASVRAVMGIRGEPTTPAIPSKGLVWSAILSQIDLLGSQSAFVSVSDVGRRSFGQHPWSIGGGGAAELKDSIEEQAFQRLGGCVESIGFTAIAGEDDAFFGPRSLFERLSIDPIFVRPLVVGDDVRDWSVPSSSSVSVIFPYGASALVELGTATTVMKHLWPLREVLWNRQSFSGATYKESKRSWWQWHQTSLDKLRTPLSIAFAFVSTHNQFVLDRGGKVFNKTAPVIKLATGASEAEHLGLLGLLNSSTGSFWLKQTCQSKGVGGIGGGIGDEAWEPRYEHDCTKLQSFPLPRERPTELARRLDGLARERSELEPSRLLERETPTYEAFARALHRSGRERMIAAQEELDWQVYRSYGLLRDDLNAPNGDVPPISLGERAFEIVLARKAAAGDEETRWFDRHGSTPLTEVPSYWPTAYRELIERRIQAIESIPEIALIERPEYKRRWAEEAWDMREKSALKGWLLNRLERREVWPCDASGLPAVQSAARLTDRLRGDTEFRTAAELYTGKATVDLESIVSDLVLEDAVPYLAGFRHTETGLRKRALWEATWDIQRREDRGEAVGDIPIPPRYDSKDFQQTEYWRKRGKLDVPKERFVLYPGAEREGDQTPVLGWAGWNHLEKAQALAALYVARRDADAFPKERLLPLLAGLLELLPWLHQWHAEVDPAQGMSLATYFDDFLGEEIRRHETSRADLAATVPLGVARRKGPGRNRE